MEVVSLIQLVGEHDGGGGGGGGEVPALSIPLN